MDKTDNLEELAEKYTILKSVMSGETTLEATLEMYEKNIQKIAGRLMSLKSLFEGEISADARKLEGGTNEIIQLVKELRYTNLDFQNVDLNEYSVSNFIKNHPSWYAEDGKQLRNAVEYVKKTEETFRCLKVVAHEIDRMILIRQIGRYLKEKPKFVKKIYTRMNLSEQKEIREKLETLIELGALDMSVRELEEFLKEVNN